MASAWPKEASKMKPKWLLEASGALLGAKWAPGASPGGSQDAPGTSRGRKKINCFLPGGLRRNFQARFHPPRGSRGPLWAPFWEALGLILALLLAIGVENAKISNFAKSPHENLDFQGSGGLPGSIFGAKNRYRNGSQERAEASSETFKIAARALLESLRGPNTLITAPRGPMIG